MNSFNWTRAAEGAVVAGILAAAAVLEPLATGAIKTVDARAIAVACFAAFTVAFVKGVGQSYQQANVVSTTITQPAGTTALTETVASPTAPATKEAS